MKVIHVGTGLLMLMSDFVEILLHLVRCLPFANVMMESAKTAAGKGSEELMVREGVLGHYRTACLHLQRALWPGYTYWGLSSWDGMSQNPTSVEFNRVRLNVIFGELLICRQVL